MAVTVTTLAACLASSSAISFPGTLLCLGTQGSRTLLKVESLLSADLVSATRLDLVLADCSAFSAAWLSEHIAMAVSHSLCSDKAQAKIAYRHCLCKPSYVTIFEKITFFPEIDRGQHNTCSDKTGIVFCPAEVVYFELFQNLGCHTASTTSLLLTFYWCSLADSYYASSM